MARPTVGCRRSAVRLLLLLAAAALALLPWARAAAHAELARAEPPPGALVSEPPRTVRLWFTERVEPRFTTLRVLDSNARRVDSGSVDTNPADPSSVAVGLGPLAEGTYTVAWQALSAVDGHLTQGVYTFTVGKAPLPPARVEAAPAGPDTAVGTGGGGYPFGSAAVRWLVYLGALAAAGGYIFRALVLGAGPTTAQAQAVATRRWAFLLWGALGTLAAASIAALLVQAALVMGQPGESPARPSILAIAFGTQWGRVGIARLVLTAGLALVTAVLGARPAPGGRGTALLHGTGLALGLATLASLSLASHAAAGSLRLMGMGADFVHLAAGATWVGGLISLAVVGLPAASTLVGEERRRFLVILVSRFSTVALASAALLVGTGLIAGWLRVGSWAALGTTPYGLTLLAKLAFFGALLVAAAGSFLYVRPRLQRAPSEGAGQLLGRLVRMEVLAGVAILLATGALTALPPAREAWARQGQPVQLERRAQDLRVRLDLEPAGLGPNAYAVTLTDAREQRVSGAEVRLRFDYLESEIAGQEVALEGVGDGVNRGEGSHLSLRGQWRATVVVRRPGSFDVSALFQYSIPSGPRGATEARLPRLRATLTGQTVLALEVAVAGLVLTAIGWRLWGSAAAMGGVVIAAGLAVLGAGGLLVFQAQVAPDGTALASRVNPIPPDTESLRIGGIIYLGQCWVCHGDSGRGDGPQAAGLMPPPLDLTVRVPLHGDGELYQFIARGVPRTAMPAFGALLEDEEVWHLVNYLREIAPKGRETGNPVSPGPHSPR